MEACTTNAAGPVGDGSFLCWELWSPVLLVWLGIRLVQGKFGAHDEVTAAVGMVIAVAGLAVSVSSFVVTLRCGRRADLERAPDESLGITAEILAMTVRRQWENEERIRRIHDPLPLPVRWYNADDVADHWENVHGSPDKHERVDLTGQVDALAAVLDRVPSGRLVVIGRAGAGKRVLMTRFVRHRLAGRGSGAAEPVPMPPCGFRRRHCPLGDIPRCVRHVADLPAASAASISDLRLSWSC